VGSLLDVEWIAVYASAMTSDVVQAKLFANPELDVHAYLDRVSGLVKRRLARAVDGAGYRFPRG
jgi:hypothetical protein